MSSFGALLFGKFDFKRLGRDVEDVGAREINFFKVSWCAWSVFSFDLVKSDIIFAATSFHQEGIVETRTVRKVA